MALDKEVRIAMIGREDDPDGAKIVALATTFILTNIAIPIVREDSFNYCGRIVCVVRSLVATPRASGTPTTIRKFLGRRSLWRMGSFVTKNGRQLRSSELSQIIIFYYLFLDSQLCSHRVTTIKFSSSSREKKIQSIDLIISAP